MFKNFIHNYNYTLYNIHDNIYHTINNIIIYIWALIITYIVITTYLLRILNPMLYIYYFNKNMYIIYTLMLKYVFNVIKYILYYIYNLYIICIIKDNVNAYITF